MGLLLFSASDPLVVKKMSTGREKERDQRYAQLALYKRVEGGGAGTAKPTLKNELNEPRHGATERWLHHPEKKKGATRSPNSQESRGQERLFLSLCIGRPERRVFLGLHRQTRLRRTTNRRYPGYTASTLLLLVAKHNVLLYEMKSYKNTTTDRGTVGVTFHGDVYARAPNNRYLSLTPF